MSETPNTPVVEPVPAIQTPPVTFKLSPTEVYSQLQSYLAQASQTLAKLQANIDAANKQVSEWNGMRLMVLGQKQVAEDLVKKLVDQPANTDSKS